jgi:peptide deformylase
MAVLEIVKWPAPVLDAPADPVTEFDADLEKLVSNMFETMYAAPGVGIRSSAWR